MDAELVISLHKALPISRRQAADIRMWAWLGIVEFPYFVAHRWKPATGGERAGQRSSERFAGSSVRQTLARLWWAAELTQDEQGHYELTEKLVGLNGFQDIYEAIFGRAFCQYQPALEAFINVVGSESEKTVRDSSKEFGYVLTTLALESMSRLQIEELLTEIVNQVKSK